MNKQRLIEKRILAQHRIVAERLMADPEKVIEFASDNLQRWTGRYDKDERPHWMHEWKQLLGRPPVEIAHLLTSCSEEANRLRSSSPFAGILSARERWALYREIQAAQGRIQQPGPQADGGTRCCRGDEESGGGEQQGGEAAQDADGQGIEHLRGLGRRLQHGPRDGLCGEIGAGRIADRPRMPLLDGFLLIGE